MAAHSLRKRARLFRRFYRRTGSATVEFAICLPVLVTMVFGVVEGSNAVYLQNALTSAAYEAANVASVSGGTSSDATARANAVLTALGAKSTTVAISPTVDAATAIGTEITVTCSAPLNANSMMFGVIGNQTFTATVIMQRL